MTAAGFFREYEVKLTIGDFKADRKKAEARVIWDDRGRFKTYGRGRTKHEYLADGHRLGPSQFWYVTPPGLVALEPMPKLDPAAVLPEWAGLFEVWHNGRFWEATERKKAKRLHREKLRPAVVDHARTIPYYRMHSLLDSLVNRSA